MLLTDVFEVVIHGEVLGQTADMVFYIGPESFPGGLPPDGESETNAALQQWVDAIVASLVDEAAASISPLYEILNWRAYMLFDPVSLYAGDVTDSPPQFTGATDLVSTFATFSMYSPTKRRGQNGAHKSIPGVMEGNIASGELVVGTATAFENVLSVWNAPIDTGVTLEWRVMWQMYNVKRIFVPGTSSHKAYYRLPENVGEFAGYVIDNWQVQPRMSTRNSRKVGRGS